MEKQDKTFFLKTPIGKLIPLTCPITKTIKSIKEFIEDHEGIKPNYCYLTHHSRHLDDENTLEDYNIHEHDTIFINIYMRGD